MQKIFQNKIIFSLGIFFAFILLPQISNADVLLPGNINSCGELAISGTYTLTDNINAGGNTCFTISSDNVTLNGNGHVINGSAAVAIDARARSGEGTALVEGANAYTNLIVNDITFTGYTTGINASGNDDTSGTGVNNGYAGDAGDVAIFYSVVGSVTANGGTSSTKTSGGLGGNVAFTDTNLNISNSTISLLGGSGTSGSNTNGGLDLNYTGTLTRTNLVLSALSFFNDNTTEYGVYPGGSYPILSGNISQCGTLWATTTSTFTLSQNISNISGTCFTIFGNNITIDGAGYSLTPSDASTTSFAISAGSYSNFTLASTTVSSYTNLITSSSSVTVSGNNLDLSNKYIAAGSLTLTYTGTLNKTGATISSLTTLTVNGVAYGAQSAGGLLEWVARTEAGSRSWYGVSSSLDGTKLAAVTRFSDKIYTSTDSGATWIEKNLPVYGDWYSVALSADGQKIAVLGGGTQIYVSSDGGTTWTARESSRSWWRISMSADGTKLVANLTNGQIYVSSDGGATWTARESSRSWRSFAISADGSKITGVVYGGYIYTSSDGGVTWIARTGAGSKNWFSVTSSSDGMNVVAGVYNGYIYTSSDGGVTWTERTGSGIRNWQTISSSVDGTRLFAGVNGGYIYTSLDSGITWTPRDSNRNWRTLAVSADGNKVNAVVENGYIYSYQNPNPTISLDILIPKPTAISTWSPLVSWSTASSCYYSFDNWTSTSTADCADYGSDIPQPTSYGTSTLYVKGIDVNGNVSEKNVAFSYNLGIGITSPIENESININSWNPVIDWDPNDDGNITSCYYSYDNWTSTSTANCTLGGADILPSDLLGNITLSLKSVNSNGVFGNNSINFRLIRTSSGSWISRDSSRNWTSITSSSDGTKLAASAGAVHGGAGVGYIYTSTTSGATWTPITSAGLKQWGSITSSADGTRLAVVVWGGYIYTSSNSGLTWSTSTNSGIRNWFEVESSSDGSILLATYQAGWGSGKVMLSRDYGVTWNDISPSAASNISWISNAMNASGTKIAVGSWDGNGGLVYVGDYVNNAWQWNLRRSGGQICGLSMSSDGGVIAAANCTTNAGVNVSTDGGLSWFNKLTGSTFFHIVVSSDGSKILASTIGQNLKVYLSEDYGSTWNESLTTPVNQTASVDMSSYGYKMFTAVNNGLIYVNNSTPTNSLVSMIRPQTGNSFNYGSWNPLVDWNDSSSCYYSYNNFTSTSTANCTLSGLDITRPPSVGSNNLYIKGINGSNVVSTSTALFTYNPITVNINSPSTGNVTSWSPNISWASASSCYYSYNNFTSTSTANCSLGGSDISTPSKLGPNTLYVKGISPDNFTSTSSVSFSYYPVISSSTINSCGTISSSGTYTLSGNITGVSGNCFNIQANNVTINGGGYTITATSSNVFYAVTAGNSTNLTLENINFSGFLSGLVSSNSSVTYSGSDLNLTNSTSTISGTLSINYSNTLTTLNTFFSNLSSLIINNVDVFNWTAGIFSWLDQDISSCQTLSSPGIYNLTQDITNVSGTCFNITSNTVIINGNGHTISGAGGNTNYAILATTTVDENTYEGGHAKNISIKDLTVTGFGGVIDASGVGENILQNIPGIVASGYGRNGGKVSLYNVIFPTNTISVNTSGGDGVDGAEPNLVGGSAGTIKVYDSILGTIQANGGNAGLFTGGYENGSWNGGSAGIITQSSSTVTQIIANAGVDAIPGCMNDNSDTYNPNATYDDGSCTIFTIGTQIDNPLGNTIAGPITFQGFSNRGVVTGDATYYGYDINSNFNPSQGNYGTTTGHATFDDGYVWWDGPNNYGYVGGGADFNGYVPSNSGVIDGITNFNGEYSHNYGTTTGNANFNGYYSSNYGTVNGNVYFQYYGQNSGTINGDADFSGSGNYQAYNYGTVNGNATFYSNDDSWGRYNYGTVTGTTTLAYGCTDPFAANYPTGKVVVQSDNGSCLYYGQNSDLPSGTTYAGDLTFCGYNNYGTVTGNATFSCGSGSNYGIIAGNGTSTGNAVFESGSYNYGTTTGSATFYDYYTGPSHDSTGSVLYVDGSFNYQGTGYVGGTVYDFNSSTITTTIFADNFSNDWTLSTDVIFNDDSYNDATIYGTTTFNGDSYNLGVINGVSIFNTTYYASTTPQNGIFNIENVDWVGIINGLVFGGDLNLITDYHFYNSTVNSSTLNANSYFHNLSRNTGTITGDMIIDTAYYSGSVPTTSTLGLTGNAEWKGTVIGDIFASDGITAITAFNFGDSSVNYTTITSSATTTFTGSASNQGVINGNTVFENLSKNTSDFTAPTDGLIAYYSFDGNANDLSGNGNNGSINGPSLNPDGFNGQAYYFNNNHITLGNPVSLRVQNITVSAWFNRDSNYQYGSYNDAITQYGGGSNGWIIRTSQAGNGRFTPHVYVNNNWYLCDGGFVNDEWTLLSLTYNGETMIGYMNGQEVCRNTSPSGQLSINGETRIGSGTQYSSEYFRGLIDDVRIYNRALSPSEISDLLNVNGTNGTVNGDAVFSGTNIKLGTVNGTAFLDGVSQTISGVNNVVNFFKNLLTQTNDTGRDTLFLTSGSTLNVSGLFTLLGADANNLLTLRSTTPNSRANIAVNGTSDFNFLRIKDIHNVGNSLDVSSRTIFNDGGNTGFTFSNNTNPSQRTGVTKSFTAPSVPVSRGGSNPSSNTGGAASSGILRNLFNRVGQTVFTPLPSVNFFNPNGGTFNPTNVGSTVVPFPFKNFKPVTQLVIIPTPKFDIGVSKFLFAPLPGTITSALKDAPKLANFIAAAGVNTEQSLAILASKPLPLKDTADGELTPGHFIVRTGIQPITTFATYDEKLGGLAEMIKASTNQPLSISLVPLSTGEVTATYLNQVLTFVKGKSYHTATLTTPFEPGRYVLKTSSSPIPLIIEVTSPTPITPKPQTETKSWSPFNFVWKLFGK